MPLFKTISLEQGLIGVWQLTEQTADLLPKFTTEEINDPTFNQYTYDKRKVEWLATRCLIRELIGPDFQIDYAASGKPLLQHNKYQFIAISHSRDFAAVFLHESKNTGIDIESLHRNFAPVSKRYLSDQELLVTRDNPLLLCLYWCAKEATFKLVPDEGVEFRQQISISPFNPETDKQFSVCFSSEFDKKEYKATFILFDQNALVWITE